MVKLKVDINVLVVVIEIVVDENQFLMELVYKQVK
jgi:hypothetical protein